MVSSGFRGNRFIGTCQVSTTQYLQILVLPTLLAKQTGRLGECIKCSWAARDTMIQPRAFCWLLLAVETQPGYDSIAEGRNMNDSTGLKISYLLFKIIKRFYKLVIQLRIFINSLYKLRNFLSNVFLLSFV